MEDHYCIHRIPILWMYLTLRILRSCVSETGIEYLDQVQVLIPACNIASLHAFCGSGHAGCLPMILVVYVTQTCGVLILPGQDYDTDSRYTPDVRIRLSHHS